MLGHDALPIIPALAGIFLCTYVKYLTLCEGIFVDFLWGLRVLGVGVEGFGCGG